METRRPSPGIVALLVVLGSLGLLTRPVAAADAGAPTPSIPACVAVTTDSRYVPYGYNHIVILKNGCSRPVKCSVATDVNPERQTVEVLPSTTTEVTTFLGAASSTFVARVSCGLR